MPLDWRAMGLVSYCDPRLQASRRARTFAASLVRPRIFLDNASEAAIAHKEYIIAPDLTALEVIERDPRLHWSAYVGAAGMPGETAFIGWREHSDAKKASPAYTQIDPLLMDWKGEVAYISTGAGPVGS